MASLLRKFLSLFKREEDRSVPADEAARGEPRPGSGAAEGDLSSRAHGETPGVGKPESEKERLRRLQAEKHARRRAQRERRKQSPQSSPLPPSRRKIPRIADDAELVRHFLGEEGPSPADRRGDADLEAEAAKFPELLEESIEHADMKAVLAEKRAGRVPERRLTVNERIAAYPEPREELDLHGFSGMEAAQMIGPFIRTCIGRNLRTVRIIPGKGLHSESDAVLPRVVERELTRLKGPGLILTFRWEKGTRRKSGSVIVYLD